MNTRPLYIFDLDGTIALLDHRLHYITGEKKDWDAFYKACGGDLPNQPIMQVMDLLYAAGAELWIWSGRREDVRPQTVQWIMGHWPDLCVASMLKMRPEKDHRPDTELKREWLYALSEEDRQRLGGVFEDRNRMAEMWRAEGVTCFQVAPGDF